MSHNYNLRSLSNKKSNSINIIVYTLQGESYNISFNEDISLKELFRLVSKSTKNHIDTFMLVYNNYRLPKIEEIHDLMTVKDFNIRNNSKLYLVLRLGGKTRKFIYNRADWFKFS